MKPSVKIEIAPAPLDQVLDEEFHRESRKLLAVHREAPALLIALRGIVSRWEGATDDRTPIEVRYGRELIARIDAAAEGR